MAKAKVLKSTVTIRDSYELNNSTVDVLLDIKIGAEGQSSLTEVKLTDPKTGESRIIVTDISGSFNEPVACGTNEDLPKKVLKISTLVQDISPDTDDTFEDIRITGGKDEFHQRMEKTVSSQGETVFYTATIRFFKVQS